MRVLVVSDVHANLVALEEVLADAASFAWRGRTGFDAVWSIGDIVGYGPHPNQCIDRIKQFGSHLRVAGNHDWAALGRLDIDDFNPEARQMVLWTREALSEASYAYLEALPYRPIGLEGFVVTHASPREPIWEYISSPAIARANFAHFKGRYCIVGHTHVPRIFRLVRDRYAGVVRCTAHAPEYDRDIMLSGDHRLILNPGSVGQPRDNDSRAAYALLDTEEQVWRFRRLPYAYEITQADMRAAGLPKRLINRLAFGW